MPTVATYLTEEKYAALLEKGKTKGKSVNETIIEAIDQYIEVKTA
jgi:hypothetical protein